MKIGWVRVESASKTILDQLVVYIVGTVGMRVSLGLLSGFLAGFLLGLLLWFL